jgi:hypothetical protein
MKATLENTLRSATADLFDRGYTQREIAKELQISPKKVEAIYKQMDIDPIRRAKAKDEYNKRKFLSKYVGKRFGSLRIISPDTTSGVSYTHSYQEWFCKCDCGITTSAPYTQLLNGSITTCNMPGHRAITRITTKHESPRMASANRVWKSEYWDKGQGCSFEIFMELSQLPCAYCGTTLSNDANIYRSRKYKTYNERLITGSFKYNGLDRLDSTKPHSPDNIVTCCKICNMMKRNMLPDEFIIHISNIYNYSLTPSPLANILAQPVPMTKEGSL